MLEKSWLSAGECETSVSEFERLIRCQSFSSLSFDVDRDRLDTFWLNVITNENVLPKVLKIALLLSHGNADVESGFSVNEDLLVENLQERSLVSQRIVYDAIKNAGGVSNVDVNKELIKSVKAASSRYKSALEERKQAELAADAALNKRKRIEFELKVLNDKKRKLELNKAIESQAIDNQIVELRKQL